MNDEPNAKNKQPQPDDKTDKKTTIVAILSAVSCTNPNAEHAENTAQGGGSSKEKPAGFIGNPDWWMVLLTGLLFVAGVITIFIFHHQLIEMGRQTGILNTQAQQSASASITASQEVERQLGYAQQQAQTAQDNVAIIQKQFRLDQKPIIWVANPNEVPEPPIDLFVVRDGKENIIKIDFNYTNLGKSPAQILWTKTGIAAGPDAITKIRLSKTSSDRQYLPGGSLDYTTMNTDPIPDQEASAAMNTDDGVVFRILFHYQDSLGFYYESDVCQARLKTGAWSICQPTGIKDCTAEHCQGK